MARRGRRGDHRRSGPARAAAGPAARPPPRRPQRRGVELMATMAAVDLGAQSGRVAVGRFDGERLDRREVHRFANVPVAAWRRRCAGTSQRLLRDVSTGCAPPARDDVGRLRRRRLVGGRLRPARPRRASSSQNPVALPRRAPRARRSTACSRGSRRASCTSARASSSADQHDLRAGGDGRRGRPGARGGRRRCC